MNHQPTTRIFGLNLLRSFAIIIVVLQHSSILVGETLNFLLDYLPDGVDLFFVLSGYLIGTILIKIINHNKKIDRHIVFNFLRRRWFRTLPNYFLFLGLNILLVYLGYIKGDLNKYLVTYFFFLQNFYKPYDFLFWESWSLCVEEWFYLIFPFVLLLLFKIYGYKIKSKTIILTTIIMFLLFPMAYRIFQAGSTLDLDLYFRKLVFTRLDTIGFGLFGAYIHWYHQEFWRNTKNIFFVLGITMILFFSIASIENIFFLHTFYYSFIGISILFILPKLESWSHENIPFKPFQFISKISYSMYLLHIPLLQIMSKTFKFSGTIGVVLTYIFFWIVIFVLSYLVYTFYENPITNLRDKKHSFLTGK
jgi:peptidoglycan/LPS O-acetylase OafA/YrhL